MMDSTWLRLSRSDDRVWCNMYTCIVVSKCKRPDLLTRPSVWALPSIRNSAGLCYSSIDAAQFHGLGHLVDRVHVGGLTKRDVVRFRHLEQVVEGLAHHAREAAVHPLLGPEITLA